MSTAHLVVTVLAITMNAAIAAADLVRAPFVLANGAAVGVPESWMTSLGALKLAGAIGLLLGLLGVPLVGTAAGIGLVLFYVGALGTHLRAGDRSATVAVPVAFLLVAALALAFDPVW